MEGLGFSTGFFFVVLPEAVLFTEANVVIPATMLDAREAPVAVARFWALAFLGNFLGALLIGGLIAVAHDLPAEVQELLREVVDRKMSFREDDGAGSWWRVVPDPGRHRQTCWEAPCLVALPFWYVFESFLTGDRA